MRTFATPVCSVLVFSLAAAALACPFCPTTAPTLSEQQAQSDIVALAQWADEQKPTDSDQQGRTTYEVVELRKSPPETLSKGERVVIAPHRSGRKGDLFLLMGRVNGPDIEWDPPQEITETAYQYIAQAPSPEVPMTKRLEYYARFLEYPDESIATDAYFEFAKAQYDEVAPVAKKLSPEKVRKWVTGPDVSQPRLGFYGMLLGLCGDESDARLLEKMILSDPDEFRLGIDGVIGGYLLLTGEQGLEVIDRTKLADPKVPVSEVYAAMSALRFIWSFGEGTIEKERLKQSMRLLLDRRDVIDLVIADLARWKDWSVQNRLMELYDAEFEDPVIQRGVRSAIIRYMLVCAKDVPKGQEESPPEHVVQAKKNLDVLRSKDAAAVKNAERFVF